MRSAFSHRSKTFSAVSPLRSSRQTAACTHLPLQALGLGVERGLELPFPLRRLRLQRLLRPGGVLLRAFVRTFLNLLHPPAHPHLLFAQEHRRLPLHLGLHRLLRSGHDPHDFGLQRDRLLPHLRRLFQRPGGLLQGLPARPAAAHQ